MPLYAGVVVEAPLTKIFHYLVPESLAGTIQPGDRARIPFARRQTAGVVVSLTEEPPPIDPARIKEIQAISPPEERIPADLLALTEWTARYYQSSWGTVLAAAVPAAIKQGRKQAATKFISLLVSPDEAEAEAARICTRAPKQSAALLAIVRALDRNNSVPLPSAHPDFKKEAPPATQRQLAKRGLIAITEVVVERIPSFPEQDKSFSLTDEQRQAVETVLPHLDAGTFKSFLMHGVTGSGKTEVYMRLIQHALELGKSALVLVPEISLTPQTAARFQRRFGRLAVLHSNLGDGERAAHWRRLATGEIRLAVGARSGVFAPMRDLGLVIVDEEHERSYKQDNDPRYNARDVAIMRAHQTGAVALLGSATPSLESWSNVTLGKHDLLTLSTRPGTAEPPRVETVDLRTEWADVKKPVLFSRRLEAALGECLKRGEQAILFLNRRGFHTSVRCQACGEAVYCPDCDVAMTHHRGAGLLRCGCCGHFQGVPAVCPTCSSASLKFVGTGTERVEDILAGIYPNARLLRMDSDSMSAQGAHESALSSFSAGEYDILLGTQMVAKGLDFPNVTLVGVLMADSALGMSDFRASERTFQLITQVIGRAGRAGKSGLAVVQAFQPEHPAVSSAMEQDYHGFVSSELPDRKRRGYPPFGRLARILLSGREERMVSESAGVAGKRLRQSIDESCRLLGPSPCEIERLQGMYRHHMLLFAPDSRTLSKWIFRSGVKPGVEKNVRLIIDTDPMSMH